MWSTVRPPADRLAVSRWIAASVTIRSAVPSPVVSTSTKTTCGGRACAAAMTILRHEGRGNEPRGVKSGKIRRVDYSTVTDFARLRGWSTSFPMKTAVW